MKKMLFAIVMLAAGTALAAEVTSSEYIRQYSLYGRSDGVFQRTDSHGIDLHVNGRRLVSLGKAIYEDFTEYGADSQWCEQNDYTACSGTNTEQDFITFPSGNRALVTVIGTLTKTPTMDVGSWDISGDDQNDEGVQAIFGMSGASGSPFIIGEDPAFYACVKAAIADVSGTDDFHVGFRRAEVATANFDDYNDLATIGIVGSSNPATIYLETIDDNAATTSTDTTNTWADGATKTLCVLVSAAGVVTYTINGSAPATTAAFTFDDADPVVPFIYFLNNAGDAAGEVDIYEWEIGYQ